VALPPPARAWLVPLAVVFAILAGSAAALSIVHSVDPSGEVQDTLTTPVAEQLDSGNVAVLFGAPYAALAAALVAYFGLRTRRPGVFAIAAGVAGVAVFAVVGAEAVAIGQWWIADVPSDTNQAAALFTILLTPPGALALQLAASPVPLLSNVRRGAMVARHLLVGAMMGLVLGSFLGSETAALTWAIHCPQTGAVNCFPVSSVVSSALLLGAIGGLGVGMVTGLLAWSIRGKPEMG
jgi:hypothetical protein